MANGNEILTFKLVIDGKEAVATIETTGAELKQINKLVDDSPGSVKSSFKETGLELLKWVGIASAVRGAFNFIIDSKNVARDAAEIQSKFDTVFGNLKIEANAFAESFGKSVGRAKSDIKEMMAGVQDTFVPLGFARQKATEYSESLVKLAVDVASFNNAQDADVLRDFQSAIVGNHETVRKYGILITENTLKQEAENEGINKKYNQLTELEKVQLRYNVILKSTTDAQGDAIRTADSLANTEKRRAAELKDLQETIGNKVVPAFLLITKAGIGWFNVINDLLGVQGELIDKTQVQAAQMEELRGIYNKYPKDFEKYRETLEKDIELRLLNASAALEQARTVALLNQELKESQGIMGLLINLDDDRKDVKEKQRILDTYKSQYDVIKNFKKLIAEDDSKSGGSAADKQKEIEDAKKKYDAYIDSIEKNYSISKDLSQLTEESNVENILSTQKLIDKELARNISLENRLKLLKLQKEIQNDLNGGLNLFDESQTDMDKAQADEYESLQANEKRRMQLLEDQREARSELKKLEIDNAIDQITNQYDRETAIDKLKSAAEIKFYEDKYKEGLLTQEEYLRAKDIIEAEYDRKSRDRDKEAFLAKINATAQIVSTISNAYNQLYSAIESSAKEEIGTWKDKEEKKLETEREAALKHARTQAQREKINEQYDKKRDQLDEEANKKARERLAAWFYINQAVSATSAVVASIAAGINTMEQLSKYLPPPLPQIAMGVTIAAGLAQAAVISQQKLPGYAKGGAVIGEDGPEIIAPFQDYASGQSKLIAMTMMTLRDEIRNSGAASSPSGDYRDVKEALTELNQQLKSGIYARAYLDDREAKKISSRGNALNRKNKL